MCSKSGQEAFRTAPSGRRKRRTISVHTETWAALNKARHPGMTWDEWLQNVAALWEVTVEEEKRADTE